MKVAFVSVVPSPYQRDLLRALAQRPEIELSVFYLEAGVPDSPWPKTAARAPTSASCPAFWFPLGHARCHVNWPLPDSRALRRRVMNTLMSITAPVAHAHGAAPQAVAFLG